MNTARLLVILVAASASAAKAQHLWTVESADPGVTAYVRFSENFLTAGPPWDSDGIEECPPIGANDVRCEWRSTHTSGNLNHHRNGVLAAVLDGSAVQTAVLTSDLWADALNSAAIWWVNYDVHLLAVDAADIANLRVTMQFQHAGITRLTLNLTGRSGAARVRHRIAPTHFWTDTPETGNAWRIRLTLRRFRTGAPAMIWVDNINVTEGRTTLFEDAFDLIAGDLTGDCLVDLADLGILLADFGCTAGPGACPGDLDGDGDTDLADLGILLAAFGSSCP